MEPVCIFKHEGAWFGGKPPGYITRKGDKGYSAGAGKGENYWYKYFGVRKYGSMEAALEAAEEWRATIVHELEGLREKTKNRIRRVDRMTQDGKWIDYYYEVQLDLKGRSMMMVDEDALDLVRKEVWRFSSTGRAINEAGKYFTHIYMDAPSCFGVRALNGDGLDNRRFNLKLVPHNIRKTCN